MDILHLLENSPALVVGRGIKEVRDSFSIMGEGLHIDLSESFDYFLEVFSTGSNTGSSVLVEDLSMLSPRKMNSLLKVVEEPKANFIFLASYDNIITPLLSRFRIVSKEVLVTTSDSYSLSALLEKLSTFKEDTHSSSIDRAVVNLCPSYLNINSKISRCRNKKKILGILETLQ